MNLAPGEIRVINKENIASISVSTHSMSLNYLIRFLEIEKDYNILFLGMEPEIMDLSFELSETVQKTADNLIGIFISIFKEW